MKLLLHEIQYKIYTTVNTPKAMSCVAWHVGYDFAESFRVRISFRNMFKKKGPKNIVSPLLSPIG
jgi:hypothetical protein